MQFGPNCSFKIIDENVVKEKSDDETKNEVEKDKVEKEEKAMGDFEQKTEMKVFRGNVNYLVFP